MDREFWEQAAKRDPLWAILSDPAKKDRRWGLQEFFTTGRREISLLLYQPSELGCSPARSIALDFGCGVGRLSQALALSFEQVVGLDISPTMLRLADRLNRFPQRVRYELNQGTVLESIGNETIDLVYSDVVLQHIPPDDSSRYVAEFLRVMRPGGVAVFQLTAEPRPIAEITHVLPMPDQAYRAGMTIATPPGPDPWEPGARHGLIVSVTNESSVAWDTPDAVIRVGNHWLDSAGVMRIQDDGRAALTPGLLPGARSAVTLTVQAPPAVGKYLCEIDVVHEGVTWFGDRGTRTVRLPVNVGSAVALDSASRREPSDIEEFPDIYADLTAETAIGEFPMYGVPQSDVLTLIARGACECVHIERDEPGGPEWIGYRYFVHKPAR